MVNILVSGSGCSKCLVTTEMIERLAHELHLAVEIEKITDHDRIVASGARHTPPGTRRLGAD